MPKKKNESTDKNKPEASNSSKSKSLKKPLPPHDALEGEVLPPEFFEELDRLKLKSSQKQEIASLFVEMQMISYSGPLPPSSEFAKYCKAHDKAGDEIIEYMKTSQMHRQQNEESLIQQKGKREFRGQTYGFILTLISIAAGIGAGYFVSPWFGGIFVGAPMLKVINDLILSHR